jgi:enoyl-[acyl-carrier protein] reductase III
MTVFINCTRHSADAEEAAARVRERGATAIVLTGDISTPKGAQRVVAQVRAETGRIDTLVHSVVKTVTGPLLDADPVAFSEAVDVNALSLLYIVQAAAPLLGNGSSVIYLSSRGARIALNDYASVGAPKALGEALVRYLAVELAPRGTRVNTLSPTAQDTDAFRSVFPTDYPARLAQAAQRSPSGRAVSLDDIVEMVRVLASPATQMLQGQTLTLDGASSLVG